MFRLDFPFDTLENDSSVIFALDEDLRLTYCNPEWDRFAWKNGGKTLRTPAPVGRDVLDSISGPLRKYYESAYRGILRIREPWEHLYECSSASVFRKFFMQVLPMKMDSGLLVVNSLRVERPHEMPSCRPLDEIYRNDEGMILMCSHCRRTRRNGPSTDLWDWVADYVARLPAGVSHGLCPICMEYYYPSI